MTKPILSILVCTLLERRVYLERLRTVLDRQCIHQPVEVVMDNRSSSVDIGAKRNGLLQRSKGAYIAYIDDDDMISADYIPLVLKALESKPDCVELNGIYTVNGLNPKPFVHTITCNSWHEKDGKYFRMPNHLNAVRRDLAIQAGFPATNHGEDHEYSKRLHPLLKTQAALPKAIYYYLYRRK